MDIGLQVALGIGVAKDYTQGGTVSREQAIADREAEIQAFEARMQQRRRITNPASADRGTPMSDHIISPLVSAAIDTTIQSAIKPLEAEVRKLIERLDAFERTTNGRLSSHSATDIGLASEVEQIKQDVSNVRLTLVKASSMLDPREAGAR